MTGAAVVGAGSWGTAFARLLVEAGVPTRLVCRRREQAERIRASGRNGDYLSGIALPPELEIAHAGEPGALEGVDLVALAVPSRAVVEMGAWLAERLPAGAGVLSLTKGLDPVSGRRLSTVWTEQLPAGTPLCVLSGPNHAEEVALRQPTASVVAGNLELGLRVQALLSGPRFRLYLNEDLVGVELCAAAKNVIALAAGMADGFGMGDNCKATLITRGLAEMTRLGTAYGARAATFRGLAGMGDLVATCTSSHSRNRRAGELIALGLPAAEVEERLGQVAEGLWTARSLLAAATAAAVELPISAEVVAAAFEGKPVAACLDDLMSRAPAAEE